MLMGWELYLAFIAASVVLVVIPGPNVTLIVANSLAYGARSALVTVAGTSMAQAVQLAVTVLGMSSLVLLMAGWFEWLRWLGVAYLLYLGVQHWRAGTDDGNGQAAAKASWRSLFGRGFLVATTNPKTLLFYAAFLPQFIDPLLPPTPQLVLLSITFLVVATLLDGSYALLGGRVRQVMRGPRFTRIRNRVTGSLLITAGVGLALARRG